jgi:hypothetical protein
MIHHHPIPVPEVLHADEDLICAGCGEHERSTVIADCPDCGPDMPSIAKPLCSECKGRGWAYSDNGPAPREEDCIECFGWGVRSSVMMGRSACFDGEMLGVADAAEFRQLGRAS